jgi:hypothetical protein
MVFHLYRLAKWTVFSRSIADGRLLLYVQELRRRGVFGGGANQA